MKKHMSASLGVILLLFVASIRTDARQVPKADRSGNPISIVRNDATGPVTIEFRNNNAWQQVKLEPGADGTITGDRVRVATTREDKAVVTVDLPVEAGKKYRVIWNAQVSIWDFSPAS